MKHTLDLGVRELVDVGLGQGTGRGRDGQGGGGEDAEGRALDDRAGEQLCDLGGILSHALDDAVAQGGAN
jgi:hypothetical protein